MKLLRIIKFCVKTYKTHIQLSPKRNEVLDSSENILAWTWYYMGVATSTRLSTQLAAATE